jgi:hypothetical protein
VNEMSRKRDLKLPRGKLPEALANALRLYGYNWQGKRSRNGKLWAIYLYGKPRTPENMWTLHSDADPAKVAEWLLLRERGEWAPAGRLLAGEPTLAERVGVL